MFLSSLHISRFLDLYLTKPCTGYLIKPFTLPYPPFRVEKSYFYLCFSYISLYKYSNNPSFAFIGAFSLSTVCILAWDRRYSGTCFNDTVWIAISFFPSSSHSPAEDLSRALSWWLPRSIQDYPAISFLSDSSSFRAIDSCHRSSCREISLGKSPHLLQLLLYMNVNCS